MHTHPTHTSIDWTSLIADLTDRRDGLIRENQGLRNQNEALRQQVAWFQRQIFGEKSERRLLESNAHQGTLGEAFEVVPETLPPNKKRRIDGYEREQKPKRPAEGDEPALFFDESKVPVEVIQVPNPEAAELAADDYEVISEKVSFRLAQRPGSYVILKYVRPVIKRRDTQTLSCPPAPAGVIEGSRADVSFIAGILVDKFAYHLPLYRQHQCLRDAGIDVSRAWLTQLTHSAVSLLAPIFEAQADSIRASRVKAMDETPIKAGRAGPGKMKKAYFWPVYGEGDEICFFYYPSRSSGHVAEAFGLKPPDNAVLQTDGYTVYEAYAKQTGLTHAQCWAHSRRKFIEARDVEPDRAEQALSIIGALYAIEEKIRDQQLSGEAKRALRMAEAKPLVDQFFEWVGKAFESQGLLPSSPLTKALAYARDRREGLEVYLNDPDVAIDTNHLERALRAIPMGRKNWLFAWTEVGAKYIGIVQSLLVTCRLHEINPYDYFVDVLQRVGQHPASQVQQLTQGCGSSTLPTTRCVPIFI
jgi:transposase